MSVMIPGVAHFDFEKVHYFDLSEVESSLLEYLQYDAMSFEICGKVDETTAVKADDELSDNKHSHSHSPSVSVNSAAPPPSSSSAAPPLYPSPVTLLLIIDLLRNYVQSHPSLSHPRPLLPQLSPGAGPDATLTTSWSLLSLYTGCQLLHFCHSLYPYCHKSL